MSMRLSSVRRRGADLLDLREVKSELAGVAVSIKHSQVGERLIDARLQTLTLSTSCGSADLGAEVREVDRARVVVQRTVVDRVLPGEPRVARGLEGDEDRLELLAGADLLEEAASALATYSLYSPRTPCRRASLRSLTSSGSKSPPT